MTTVDWLHKMREAQLSQEQAEAIASGVEDRLVTRDHLDARLQGLEHRLVDTLTMRMLGVAGLVIVIVGLLDKFVRP